MKTIGLIGGMSWESTASYYQLLNEGVREKLGGFHSAKIIMHSVDFDEIHRLQHENRWDEAGEVLAKHAHALEVAGADFILICTNTMHKVANIIEKNLTIPIVHIAEATADAINEKKCKKSILLGTKFTMSEDFNKKILEANGIKIVVPDEESMKSINSIIFDELVLGKVLDKSKKRYIEIIENLCENDKEIDSVILGCTEIGLLIKKDDINLQIFDTTPLHVNRALHLAL
ncbi:MAG TPA: aspartate/glutamate racemase family protein [Sulfurospirillum arcachonense]|nr:aspartate/glutamate racemase family protein [Sulfurospirillum arcachonense]HIP44378.1 aspartate/glutamate racemase family protein [Sulfurospirillum arcachonense]